MPGRQVAALACIMASALLALSPIGSLAAPDQAIFTDGVLIYADRSDPEGLDPTMFDRDLWVHPGASDV